MQSGIVTLIGRPNVGKSSLLNALIGRKASIVSHKPQTTRHAIQGVLHRPEGQVVFVDTPGLHQQARRALNRAMNDAAANSLHDVDLVVFVVESLRWTDEDQAVLERLRGVSAAVALVINKVDRVTDKSRLLPELERLGALRDFAFIMPLSATKGYNVQVLAAEILGRMPEGPPLYPPDMIVGYDNVFLAAETVREKLTRLLHKELPYALTVAIESYAVEPLQRGPGEMHRIGAVVWVEREGQKKIVIGEDGGTLKQVGTAARRELEKLLGGKVFLQLWCRVRDNWSDDPKSLKQFGLSGD
ncbi:GTPase Era [Panacagrimonas sp.]|uniref:GTPase Era n=1 Tax=Panacagrimonas sp. TaxID=2480088 RepID=UPI003B527BD0